MSFVSGIRSRGAVAVSGLAAKFSRNAVLASELEKLKGLQGEQRMVLFRRFAAKVIFEELSGKPHASIPQQLFTNEHVHLADSPEDLVQQRVGGYGTDKRCFTRQFNLSDGRDVKPEIVTGVFVKFVKVPLVNGGISYADIPGNIEGILEAPVADFETPSDPEQEAVIAVPYTISSNFDHSLWAGGGRLLIQEVYNKLYFEAFQSRYTLQIATLSPLRPFNRNPAANMGLIDFVDDPQVQDHLRVLALEYLLNGDKERISKPLYDGHHSNMDLVMAFHLGNGAYIGDIKFNPGNAKDAVMVNYVYPSNPVVLAANKAAFKAGQRPMAAHLTRSLENPSAYLRSRIALVDVNAVPFDPSGDRPEMHFAA